MLAPSRFAIWDVHEYSVLRDCGGFEREATCPDTTVVGLSGNVLYICRTLRSWASENITRRVAMLGRHPSERAAAKLYVRRGTLSIKLYKRLFCTLGAL